MESKKQMGNYLLFLLALILCSVSLMAETYGERLEKLRRTEAKMDFYGRLLDQYGKPVPNAEIIPAPVMAIRPHITGNYLFASIYLAISPTLTRTDLALEGSVNLIP